MTIYEIKQEIEEKSPYFFSKKTLRFFGQKLTDFKTKTMGGDIYIYAPSYWDKKLMGYTVKRFCSKQKALCPILENGTNIRNEKDALASIEDDWKELKKFKK